MHEFAIDETLRARGHDYITLAADTPKRRMLVVAEGRNAAAIGALANEQNSRGYAPAQVTAISIEMSAAYITGCGERLSNARLTFDQFQVVWYANQGMDRMCHRENCAPNAPSRAALGAAQGPAAALGRSLG